MTGNPYPDGYVGSAGVAHAAWDEGYAAGYADSAAARLRAALTTTADVEDDDYHDQIDAANEAFGGDDLPS